ncbi:competence protein ComEC [Natronobacterium texcoconense]|uniref:Competence protein ComEC n=2 Tax=Natronobacterium texcoconense TaxID=1095778 RepID=A0A1H1FWQ9_NATTX|nr:competence protein ComEC [Natronobacterium texcoconense]
MLVLAGCVGGPDGGDNATVEDDLSGEDVDEPDDGESDEDDEAGTQDEPDEDTEDEETTTDTEDEETTDAATVDGDLEIHHIDVGQADATLLITPSDETILVDTGDWRQDGSDVIDYLESHDIDRIDHLVATHPHADHIGGHAAVIEHFETDGDGIGAAYDSGIPHTSQTYENYLDAVEEYDVELLLVEEGDELPIDDESVSALVTNPPAGESGDDLHYNSVSLALEFGEFRYVTTGDAEEDAEQRMVEEWGDDLEGDVYQAGHHGSSTSSTEPFVDAVSPEIAVISSDYDSQYGHPHDEVLEEFADRGIETYWTGVHGDVVVTTDGSEIDVEAETTFSTDAEDLLEEKHAEDDAHSSLPAMVNTPAGLIPLVG